MAEESQANPLRKRPTVYSKASEAARPGTIPVFKLLGDPTSETCVLGDADYALARARLPQAIRTFVDAVRDLPVLCLGLDPVRDVFLDILAQFMAAPTSRPAELLFLESDAAVANPELLSRLDKYQFEAIKIRATPGELAAAASEEEAKAYSGRVEQISKDSVSDHEAFFRRSQVAVLVNGHTTARIPARDKEHLTDILFAPERYKWDPFVHKLDIRRTLTDGLLDSVRSSMVQSKGATRPVVLLRGNVAAGKSTLLKRLALELAIDNYTVVWLRPSNFIYTPETIREMMKRAKGYNVDLSKKGVVVFQDDPVRFGSVTPSLLSALAIAAGVDATFVIAYRTSDYENWRHDGVLSGVDVAADEAVPDSLDDAEWAQLRELLLNTKIASDSAAADAMLSGSTSRLSHDTLVALYFLVPKARRTIVSAIKDEHHRLGQADALARQFVEAEGLREGVCREALELVTVADHYRILPPVEVLVAALGISFQTWASYTQEASPVWGVLYEVEGTDEEGQCYVPRNHVITRVVREAINLGYTGHSGDLSRLKAMLAVCTGSQPFYREFCVRLLVTTEALKELTGDEGRQLFETALGALPYRDKTLLHHYGNWLRKQCNDTTEARKILEEALEADDAPYATQRESNYHIANSLAALDVQEIKAGKRAKDEGAALAAVHLEQGRDGMASDTHGAHIGANLACELLEDFSPTTPNEDAFKIAEDALSQIHMTLFNLNSFAPLGWKGGEQAAAMLMEVESKLIGRIGELEQLQETATKMWQHASSQRGFAIVGRKLLHKAREKNKGGPYKAAVDYLEDAIHIVSEDDVPVGRGLWELLMQAYYQWRIGRYTHSRSMVNVEWSRLLRISSKATNGGLVLAPPLTGYVYGLSLAHNGKWPESQHIFSEMRKMRLPTSTLFEARDFLYGSNGAPMVVHGSISEDVRKLLRCEDPTYTFICDERSSWPREGETAHAEIRFSYAGPKAYPAPL